MPRHQASPLGIIEDWWDRSEEQMRKSLHAHILCWLRKIKRLRQGYESIPAVIRTGDKQQQRPSDVPVPILRSFQEDDMYYKSEVACVWAEMVRPDVGPVGDLTWGGYAYETLIVAGLAHHIQATLGWVWALRFWVWASRYWV